MAPRLPPPVLPGDRVGVAALSSAVDAERLGRGLEALARLGFEPVPADNLSSRHRIFAGSDAERLAAFHRLAADPSLRAILFARGGHGVLRLLPAIDWPLLALYPRAYVGYSDLTPFLLAVVQRLGWVSFHGPMVAADLARGLDAREESSLLAALGGRTAATLELDGGAAVGPTAVEGLLLGGCLSLLASAMGTPWAPHLEEAILFWEDVEEPIYRLDRMLTQLNLSGTLAAVRGMVVGRMCSPDVAAGQPSGLVELLRETSAELALPVAWGLPSGHSLPNLTLPLGVPARLEGYASGWRLTLAGAG